MAWWLCHVMPYVLQGCVIFYPSLSLHHWFSILSVLLLFLFKSVSHLYQTFSVLDGGVQVCWQLGETDKVNCLLHSSLWSFPPSFILTSTFLSSPLLQNFSHFHQHFKVWWREKTLETKRLLFLKPSFHVCLHCETVSIVNFFFKKATIAESSKQR